MPASDHDPFDTLGLPRQFSLSASEIEVAYLRFAARLHPDLGSRDEAARVAAERRMAQLNEARDVVADEERRANALLDLIGGPSAAACRDLPDGFLQDMMELGMAVEEASDGGESFSEVEASLRESRDEVIAEVATLFDACTADASEDHRRSIRLALNRWRYIERLTGRLHGVRAL